MAEGQFYKGLLRGQRMDWGEFLRGGRPQGHAPVAAVDGQVNFLQRELLRLQRQVLERPLPPLDSAMVIPRDFGAGAYADSTGFTTGDGFGKMTPVAGLATDFPEVGVSTNETILPVREFGVAYGWGRKEMIRAAALGQPLSERKARMARRAYEELVDELAAVGHPKLGVKGLLSYEDIPRQVASKALSAMSTDEQLTFLHGLFEAVNKNTNETREANTLVLPRYLRDQLAHGRIGGGDGNESVLSIFLRENSYCTNVVTWRRFKGAGSTRKSKAHDIIGAWTPDPDMIRQQIPEEFTELEPEMVGGRTIINCVASIGSVEVVEPKGIILAEVPQA